MTNTNNDFTIFVLNPGSTSTKVALYRNTKETCFENISHSAEELRGFDSIVGQTDFRKKFATDFLETALGAQKLNAIAARGGLLKPVPSGVYKVNDAMLEDLLKARYGEHSSNLGAIIAAALAKSYKTKAYIADPVVVDEMDSVARISGIPEIERRSRFHALNQKSAARFAAEQLGKPYDECNLIVAHMGGGISVGAHSRGRVVDVNDALNGDGPFSPERSGGVPVGQLVELTSKLHPDLESIKRKITGQGGLVAYCGTNDLREVSKRIEAGDSDAKLVFDSMVYQISKEIAAHGATLEGDIDAIVLTGGMAANRKLVKDIELRISFLGSVIVIPGEREMLALAERVYDVLCNNVQALDYVKGQ